MSCSDELSQRASHSTSDFRITAGNFHVRLVVLSLAGVLEVKESHETLISHLIVRRKHGDVSSKVKATRPHC